MLKITNNFLLDVAEKAKQSPRKRHHHNFHKNYLEPVQRLLNACSSDSYFRPHRHTDSGKVEILLILRGSLVVVTFDDNGNVKDHFLMDTQNGVNGVELYPEEWHSIVILEPETVMYEIKEGPFDASKAKVFPDWAPEEGSPEAETFIREILNKIGLQRK